MKASLLDIVLTQTRQALAALRLEGTSEVDLERQLDDLFGAAQLVGDEELEDEVRGITEQIQDAREDGVDALHRFAQVLQTKIRLAEAADDFASDSPTNSLPRRPVVGDTSPTRVHRTARRKKSSFDTGEHRTLLNIFLDEAREGLERITGILLTNSDATPDDDQLDELMRLTHGLKGAAGTVDLPHIAELAHEYESAFERVRNSQLSWSRTIRDDLVEIADGMLLTISNSDGIEASAIGAAALRDQIRQLGSDTNVDGATSELRTEEVAALEVSDGTRDESFTERRRPDRRGADNPMLRVDPGRIDRLMNCVGELVFDRSRIEKRANKLASEVSLIREALEALSTQRATWVESGAPVRVDQLGAALSELESTIGTILPALEGELTRLGEDTSLLRRTEFALQDGLTAVRMQSVRSLFGRLTPQLRVIARQTNKQVRLVTAGGETEFDKTVADQLVDPLIQLLRNAVAHGIETPAERQKSGKSPEGRIMVTARHEANVVVIEVSDDGTGIRTDELRRRFVDDGLWTEAQASAASDERTLQMIFDAGTSSRDTTDQLAGRGVGLSTVRETVTRLGGEVLVSSQVGLGTRFTMRLPLTTAIADAMLFKIGGHVFALSNVHVLDQSEIPLPLCETTTDGDGRDLPLVPLHDLLGFPLPSDLRRCPVVLLEFMGKRLAITCDRIIGTREIVIKNLGPMLAGIPLYGGGTISPSGKVQLILDPAALVNIAYPGPPVVLTPAPEDQSAVSRKVLVVDDSKAIREAMRSMLLKAGYEVDTASDGAAAWLRLQERNYAAMVTDLEMPGEDGFTLLSRASNYIRRTGMQVLVISSKDTARNRARVQELGASAFLAKPVGQQALIDALRAARRNAP